MNIELESMAIEMPRVEAHPNREEFRGVLTVVDTASDRPPAGARGHRVMLTRGAAEEGLASLLGMGLDYAPSLDRHDAQRKVGIITRAEIAGRRVELGGYLFAKDFPDLVRRIRGSGGGGAGGLGMSYEIADARVEDTRATVWKLTQVTFTGAAILLREKAAYRETWIEMVSGRR
jgi:hypothetical protein